MNKQEQQRWATAFCVVLNTILDSCYLSTAETASGCAVHQSTVSHWRNGRSLPRQYAMSALKDFITDNARHDTEGSLIYDVVSDQLSTLNCSEEFERLKNAPNLGCFAATALEGCYAGAHYGKPSFATTFSTYEPMGSTGMVVFDFDGTLTKGRTDATTWESLWMAANYSKRDCQRLHNRFNRGEITHKEWCDITQAKFTERHLNRNQVREIGRSIELLDGVEDTFQAIREKGVPIYIVSGSIHDVIDEALGNLKLFVEEIKANRFKYDNEDVLCEIIGTPFDFEGKAHFIREKADELHMSTQDVLFVGNSINDRFAFSSGAQTLCINPKLVNIANVEVWNDCIETCENLMEIMQYIH